MFKKFYSNLLKYVNLIRIIFYYIVYVASGCNTILVGFDLLSANEALIWKPAGHPHMSDLLLTGRGLTHFINTLSAHYSNLVKNIIVILIFWLQINDAIRSRVCTCHDSAAVVTCGKLWPDCIMSFWIRTTCAVTRFGSLAHMHLVNWAPGSWTCTDGHICFMWKMRCPKGHHRQGHEQHGWRPFKPLLHHVACYEHVMVRTT